MENECRGCMSFKPHISLECRDEAMLHLSETEQCPCSTCLVKVICTMGCEDFKNYARLCKIKIGDKSIEGY